jgi:hypothetical protein
MSLMDSLRKGFRFFLMSFGISSPTKKPASLGNQPPKPPAR